MPLPRPLKHIPREKTEVSIWRVTLRIVTPAPGLKGKESKSGPLGPAMGQANYGEALSYSSIVLKMILIGLSLCYVIPFYFADILTQSYSYRSSVLQILTGDTCDGNLKSKPLQTHNQLLDTGHPTVEHGLLHTFQVIEKPLLL